MKRRDFVSKVLITGGALSLGISCQREIKPGLKNEVQEPVRLNKETGKTM